jgi:uncharacterized protein
MDLIQFKKEAEKNKEFTKKFLTKLSKAHPRKVDDAFHQQHEEVFEEIDCLTCGNCCKTTSPT